MLADHPKRRLGIVLAPFAALPAAEFVAVAREAEAARCGSR